MYVTKTVAKSIIRNVGVRYLLQGHKHVYTCRASKCIGAKNQGHIKGTVSRYSFSLVFLYQTASPDPLRGTPRVIMILF